MFIGFTGKAGSGKSSAILAIKKLVGENRAVSLTKFAGPLYSIQAYAYGMLSGVYTPPDDFIKDRELLQWLGDWAKRRAGDTVFADLLTERVKKISKKDPTVIHVCDDVRFDFEAKAIKDMGGVVVKITSNRAFEVGGIPGHHSENGIDDEWVDYHIENTGTIEELEEQIKTLFEQINK